MSVTRRVFPEAFKREAVDLVRSSGLSVGAVARELGLHETELRRWMMQFEAQATGTPRRPNTQGGRRQPAQQHLRPGAEGHVADPAQCEQVVCELLGRRGRRRLVVRLSHGGSPPRGSCAAGQ